jgi:hypothetical protein
LFFESPVRFINDKTKGLIMTISPPVSTTMLPPVPTRHVTAKIPGLGGHAVYTVFNNAELTLMILSELDNQSLSRVGGTCARLRELVKYRKQEIIFQKVRTPEELAGVLTDIYRLVCTSMLNSIYIGSESNENSHIFITIGNIERMSTLPTKAWPCFEEFKVANNKIGLLAKGKADFQEDNKMTINRMTLIADTRKIAVVFYGVQPAFTQLPCFDIDKIVATLTAARKARLQAMAQ